MSSGNTNDIAENRRLEDKLRTLVLDEIERQRLSTDAVAKRLGMLPSGASMLLERTSWPLELAIQIARDLGMKVELSVTPPQE